MAHRERGFLKRLQIFPSLPVYHTKSFVAGAAHRQTHSGVVVALNAVQPGPPVPEWHRLALSRKFRRWKRQVDLLFTQPGRGSTNDCPQSFQCGTRRDARRCTDGRHRTGPAASVLRPPRRGACRTLPRSRPPPCRSHVSPSARCWATARPCPGPAVPPDGPGWRPAPHFIKIADTDR